jgi:TonB family protein
MKCHLGFGIGVWLICGAFLFAQGNPSSSEQKNGQKPPDRTSPNKDCSEKPTAALGPIDVLTDTMGVDFGPYLQRVLHDIKVNWYNLIPESAHAPIKKQGKVTIEFAILKNGSVAGMKLISTSGDVALDRAAWGGIADANPFLPMPSEFRGRYLGLRFAFYYNPDKVEFPMRPCVTTAYHVVGEVNITVSPASPTVVSGSREQFSAMVTGKMDSAKVNWKVSGSGCSGSACGSISPEGLYIAPSSVPNPPSVIVTATLETAPSEGASATVTIIQPTP